MKTAKIQNSLYLSYMEKNEVLKTQVNSNPDLGVLSRNSCVSAG